MRLKEKKLTLKSSSPRASRGFQSAPEWDLRPPAEKQAQGPQPGLPTKPGTPNPTRKQYPPEPVSAPRASRHRLPPHFHLLRRQQPGFHCPTQLLTLPTRLRPWEDPGPRIWTRVRAPAPFFRPIHRQTTDSRSRGLTVGRRRSEWRRRAWGLARRRESGIWERSCDACARRERGGRREGGGLGGETSCCGGWRWWWNGWKFCECFIFNFLIC